MTTAQTEARAIDALGNWCQSSGFRTRNGSCRNPDGCSCHEISALQAQVERLTRERDEAIRRADEADTRGDHYKAERDAWFKAAKDALETGSITPFAALKKEEGRADPAI